MIATLEKLHGISQLRALIEVSLKDAPVEAGSLLSGYEYIYILGVLRYGKSIRTLSIS